ncbi:hypothetical protein Poli38472_011986 [Pythium oligandrum]|uniref:Prolyl endopeptidase n=1 Tax=Pythium oligandrum TaxID=41045 RepID=A0A8K1FK90_PYTOL|nr:hypothetical protein Poli38472_011986 [Pythium oligandrum]|eukprot:TMW66870.1 hypothetical protein Poli38472_011986 [Pythium oligandrum]
MFARPSVARDARRARRWLASTVSVLSKHRVPLDALAAPLYAHASITTAVHQRGLEWMKDVDHPKLHQFLKMEESYLRQVLSKPRFRQIERAMYLEFRARLPHDEETIPERIGSYEYYIRQQPGQNFPVYYRRHLETQDEQVVLNQNQNPMLHQDFHFIIGMKISPNEEHMLLVQENAHEEYRVLYRNLRTGRVEVLEHLHQVRNVEWCSNHAFYFTQVDLHRRPYAVSRYDLITKELNKMYEESDEAVFLDVSSTKDNAFVLINCNSKNSSEIYALSCSDESTVPQPVLLRAREAGTSYFADHASGRFVIVTNADQAQNYKIVTQQDTGGSWETLLPESPDVKIEDVDLFEKFLVIYERVQSVPRIRVVRIDPGSDPQKDFHYVPLPEEHAICRITPGVNREYRSPRLRFSISTPLVPEIVYDYDLVNQELHVLKETYTGDAQVSAKKRHKASKQAKRGPEQQEIESKLNPRDFECRRVFVPTHDGVHVPMTLIHRRGLPHNGKNPTLVLGYGAYGTNMEADFELEHLSLLERGWVIAKAHVRGGGELGLQWYHAGRRLQKMNTFHDFVACTTHLLDQGYTTPALLAGKGVSAGGLIMGYMANEYPSLFKAMILKVPFVDILETMQDASLPLTVHEYDEWGNPADPDVLRCIQQYAPCENLKPGQVYPSMFVTGSLNDIRVQFWEPVKWIHSLRRLQAANSTAKLGSLKESKPLFLLKMSEDDGHFGGGGRLEQLQEAAMEYAFLYHTLRLPFPDRTN